MSRRPPRVPYLSGAYVVPARLAGASGYPLTLGFAPSLDLTLDDRVTIFVGENGCGKSTLIEALAELVGLPWDGGSSNELADSEDLRARRLAHFMRPRIKERPPNKYFFRAEALSDFSRLLERRAQDPDFTLFGDDPYELYGGRSIRTRAHGEAVSSVLYSRDRPGLYILDEPEAALSPVRQEQLVRLINEQCSTGQYQYVIATHSPIVMSIEGASIRSLDEARIAPIRKEDTSHWRVFSNLLKTGRVTDGDAAAARPFAR